MICAQFMATRSDDVIFQIMVSGNDEYPVIIEYPVKQKILFVF